MINKPVFKKRLCVTAVSAAVMLMAGCQNDQQLNAESTTPNALQQPALVAPANPVEVMKASAATVPLTENQVAVFYRRKDGQQNNWGLHLWGEDGQLAEGVATSWDNPKMPDGVDPENGAFYIIDLAENRNEGQHFNFIIRDKAGNKDCGDRVYSLNDNGKAAFTLEGSCKVSKEPVPGILLENASAHFLDEPVLVWNTPTGTSRVELVSSVSGSIRENASFSELTGQDLVRIPLIADGTLAVDVSSPYPGFNGMPKWRLPDSVSISQFKHLLKGQLVVLAKDADGNSLSATHVQFPFALDGLYYHQTDLAHEQLGASYEGENVVIKLWAPTARKVVLQLATSGNAYASVIDKSMDYDSATGVWSFSADTKSLDRKFYRFQVEVYRRDTGNIETVNVTDPYSLNVSANGAFSQVVNLNDADTMPEHWNTLPINDGKRPENIVIYESHIRDISGSDKAGTGVSIRNNGKYKAFNEAARASMRHLKGLAEDGLTYFQILPAFDIATIDEDPASVANLDDLFSKLCDLNPVLKQDNDFSGYCSGTATIGAVFDIIKKDDTKPQALNDYLRTYDSFNWGYDPFHYTVPEGSYASEENGVARIREFREMVASLNAMGLRVAMDVVYNHTNAAGLAPKSVLDKIVPDYYQRLDMITGTVETSSCCSNTASEQKMMAKLMKDSLAVWTRDYKIDAFRFDLMGLHLKQNMLDIKQHLEAINPAMYLYGEGWTMPFGGGAGHDQTTATQINLAGTGIGTFSDRLRDAVRGGGPFDGGEDIRQNQGFGSGAWAVRNELNQQPDEMALKNQMDLIRVGLAGNLAEYRFTNYQGQSVKGADVDYNGAPGGYTLQPLENVGYVSKHDNQTLWDNNQYKLSESLSARDRTKMQILSQALPILSQGVPFIHMGAELLRSKSMQRDSYDSGDWFNRVDFNLGNESWNNNWNVGLPRADKDQENWSLIRRITANDKVVPSRQDALLAKHMMSEYLTIRRDSKLFSLQTAEDVYKAVKFHNTGVDQKGGLIIMELRGDQLTPAQSENIVVAVNATAKPQSFPMDNAVTGYRVHPNHHLFNAAGPFGVASADKQTLNIPARAVVVFQEVK